MYRQANHKMNRSALVQKASPPCGCRMLAFRRPKTITARAACRACQQQDLGIKEIRDSSENHECLRSFLDPFRLLPRHCPYRCPSVLVRRSMVDQSGPVPIPVTRRHVESSLDCDQRGTASASREDQEL